jgi:hypothetical protein
MSHHQQHGQHRNFEDAPYSTLTRTEVRCSVEIEMHSSSQAYMDVYKNALSHAGTAGTPICIRYIPAIEHRRANPGRN